MKKIKVISVLVQLYHSTVIILNLKFLPFQGLPASVRSLSTSLITINLEIASIGSVRW